MKKSLFIIYILCITLILSACSWTKVKTTADDNAGLTKEQWMQDIDYLKENLAANHYDVYHTLSKEEYDKKFSDLKKEVPKLKGYEIKLKLAQIVTSVGDAHTSLSVYLQPNEKRYLIGTIWFGSKLRLLAVEKDYKHLLGYNLVAINGMPIDEVIAKINTIVSHDNEQWLKVINIQLIKMPEVLKFIGVAKEDKTEFTFQNDSGIVKKISLSPQVLDNENYISYRDVITNKPLSLQLDYNDPYNSLFWYRYVPDDKIMYFQYNSCIDREVARNMGYKDYDKYPDFNEFSDKLIKELNDKQVDKLIIDLRNNTGGSDSLMRSFAGKLYSIDKLRDKGKIFVLAGNTTISSGVMACLTLKKTNKAIFIGEPTGGNENHYGEVKILTLPNSKIQVSYSTKYFLFTHDNDGGVKPDMTVTQSFEDYLKGIDDVYEAAKSYKN